MKKTVNPWVEKKANFAQFINKKIGTKHKTKHMEEKKESRGIWAQMNEETWPVPAEPRVSHVRGYDFDALVSKYYSASPEPPKLVNRLDEFQAAMDKPKPAPLPDPISPEAENPWRDQGKEVYQQVNTGWTYRPLNLGSFSPGSSDPFDRPAHDHSVMNIPDDNHVTVDIEKLADLFTREQVGQSVSEDDDTYTEVYDKIYDLIFKCKIDEKL